MKITSWHFKCEKISSTNVFLVKFLEFRKFCLLVSCNWTTSLARKLHSLKKFQSQFTDKTYIIKNNVPEAPWKWFMDTWRFKLHQFWQIVYLYAIVFSQTKTIWKRMHGFYIWPNTYLWEMDLAVVMEIVWQAFQIM